MNAVTVNQRRFEFAEDADDEAATDAAGRLVLVPAGHEQQEMFDVPVARVRKHAKPRSVFNGTPLNEHELQFRAVADRILRDHQRPQVLADCMPGGFNAARPCPWVSCKHHLAVDVNANGAIKLNFPDVKNLDGREYLTDDYVAIEDAPATCVFDVVDPHDGLTTAQAGARLNCVESNIQRIEHEYLAKIREACEDLEIEPGDLLTRTQR